MKDAIAKAYNDILNIIESASEDTRWEVGDESYAAGDFDLDLVKDDLDACTMHDDPDTYLAMKVDFFRGLVSQAEFDVWCQRHRD